MKILMGWKKKSMQVLAMRKLKDFPKLESPFERETVGRIYQCVPKIRPDFEWVWSEDCVAVEKIDGTNVSIFIQKGAIKAILNRTNVVDVWKSGKWFYEGVKNAIERDYFDPKNFVEEQLFGELIGPKLQGNPYNLEEHLWVPFSYLKENYSLRFWAGFAKECSGKTASGIFEKTSELFKGLWSVYKRQRGIKG